MGSQNLAVENEGEIITMLSQFLNHDDTDG
jgi:hypothetical protein